MKKVLIFRQELLPYSETFIRQQVLACKKWRTVLVGMRDVKGLPLDDLNYIILQKEKRSLVERIYGRALRILGLYPPSVVRRLRAENPDLIHVHFAWDAVLFYPLLRLLGKPIVVTLHGYDINVHPSAWEKGDDARARRYPHRLLALAQRPDVHFIAVSEAIRQTAIARGIPAANIVVEYIGVDTAQFRPGPPINQRKPRILFTGRMVEKKGPTYLIEAFARVQSKIPNAELVMIGNGPLLEDCKVFAKKLDIEVTFPGNLSTEKVRDYLDTVRVFCLPSITATNGDAEGFGIVLLEAQACGVPVVTSARGGATEGIEDGITGLAFPEKNVDALTDCLLSLLQDEPRLLAMSIAAPAFVGRKFDLQFCTEGLEDYYDQLTS